VPAEFIFNGERRIFDPTERDVRYRLGPWSASEDGGGAHPVDDGEVVIIKTGHGDDTEGQDVLMLEFPVAETGFDSTDEVAWLFWDRDDSSEHGLAGFDAVTVIGGESSDAEIVDLLRRLVEALAS